MARNQHLGLSLAARPGQDIKPQGILRDDLFLDMVALRSEAIHQPLAHTFFIACNGLDLREVLMESKEIMDQVKVLVSIMAQQDILDWWDMKAMNCRGKGAKEQRWP